MLHHNDASGQGAGRGEWLVLLYQVPGRSSSVRVRVWRRLQSIGAVQVRQSAYVLPHRDQPREDLEWLKTEIVGLGGEATLFAADAVDRSAHDEIVEAFRAARGRDVAALVKRAVRWLRRAEKLDSAGTPLPGPLARAARSLLDDWRALTAITYFDVPGIADMEAIVQQISHYTAGRTRRTPATPDAVDRTSFVRRRWVTRPRPGVDRMSSAWLIRRFIDPQAQFEFSEAPVADAVPFDMYGVEFGHHGDACTFEVLADRFGIDDPAVRWIGRLVHDLDLRESRFNEPETAGLGLMVEGLRHAHPEDRELLERGIALFQSLALAFPGRRGDTGAPAAPSGLRRRSEGKPVSASTGRRRRAR